MPLGLMLNNPEEEHSCFYDNTNNIHFYGALGVHNSYEGTYTGIDGSVTTGASLRELVAEKDGDVADALSKSLDRTQFQMVRLKTAAEAGMRYDMMPDPGNEASGQLIQDAIDRCGSESLDDPKAVFQLDGDADGPASQHAEQTGGFDHDQPQSPLGRHRHLPGAYAVRHGLGPSVRSASVDRTPHQGRGGAYSGGDGARHRFHRAPFEANQGGAGLQHAAEEPDLLAARGSTSETDCSNASG